MIKRYAAQGIKSSILPGINPLEAWDKAAREQGDCFHYWTDIVIKNPNIPAFITNIGPNLHLQLVDSAYVKEFYVKELECYRKGWINDILGLILEGAMGFTDVKVWQARRKIFAQAFHFDFLQQKFHVIENHSINFCTRIHPSKQETFDVLLEAQNLMANIVGEFFFGRDLSNIMIGDRSLNQSILQMFTDAMDAFTSPLTMLLGTGFAKKAILPAHKSVFRQKAAIQECCRKLIVEKQEEMKNLPESYVPKNFLEIMIKSKDKDPEAEINNTTIVQEYITIFFGAVDTTAVLILKSLYFIGMHPECRDKLIEELDANWSVGKPIDIQIINKLEYLNAFVKEVHRFNGVIGTISERVAVKDHQLGDIKIKKGDTVAVGNRAMGFNTKVYKDPLVFNPERFLKKDGASVPDAFAFVPFAAGKRICLGQNLATLEAKIILMHFLGRYTVELPKDYKFQTHIVSVNYIPIETLHIKPILREKKA
eukprot:CAMPEP_0176470434 /NCGR_PEP_ID=MMETSP0127-20121128/40452_1 /TAXON_ID=938130 /ORGANISM="Platyophrya macrostoma, Strain WH" /LENGTH=480 /DNA_ID=CAMNT_0017864725 /DNA_START=128 /DNA_END=1570 /DNA_ORIENTATION=+